MAIYLPGTADDQSLALDEMTPREIVAELDKQGTSTSDMRIIHLKHSDATATSKLIQNVFKSASSQAMNPCSTVLPARYSSSRVLIVALGVGASESRTAPVASPYQVRMRRSPDVVSVMYQLPETASAVPTILAEGLTDPGRKPRDPRRPHCSSHQVGTALER